MIQGKRYSSESSRSHSGDEKDTRIPLKLKHKNRVKRIAHTPKKFVNLDALVRRKYDEFKKGKESYTMCYLDDENELINISDEEDYTVFKEYVKDNDLSIAKVFLTPKGEEAKFNPIIDDAQTVNESIIMDEDYSRLQMMRSSLENPYIGQGGLSRELLDEIKSKLDYLVSKEKEAKKPAKKQKKKSPKAKSKPKKKKDDKKKPKDKVKEKEVKLERTSSVEVIDKHPKPKDYIAEPIIVPKVEDVKIIEKVEVKEEKPVNIEVKVIPESPKPAEQKPEPAHEFGIQPAFKRKNEKEAVIEPEEEDAHCTECKEGLDDKIKYICSICADYYLWELCELKSDHNHVFIKLKPGVIFDPKAYDKFWQKMIGIYAPPINQDEERDIQEAIMNVDKTDKQRPIEPLMAKRAQILNKDIYKEGLVAKRGEVVTIEWEVKNFTNREWSKDVIIVCLPTSDIIVNEQKVNICLKGSDKGKVSIKFIVPKNTNKKEILGVNLWLFDKIEKKFIGDELKVNLALID